jgi:hypothetical protein
VAEIGSSMVSLRIFGKKLVPEDITRQLGCFPTEAAKAGDKKPKPDGSTMVIKKGYWRLEYGERNAISLEEKIGDILDRLTQDLQAWHNITHNYQADLFCGIFLDSWNEGFDLCPELMCKLCERNLRIEFDIYIP